MATKAEVERHSASSCPASTATRPTALGHPIRKVRAATSPTWAPTGTRRSRRPCSKPSEAPPNGRADITLRVGSDDLVDLVEGRISVPSAFTSGKVKVDASIVDLLRLRSLL